MRRSSPSSSALLGALLLISFVAWVLSQIWLYLVVGSAVALISWMAYVLVRSIRRAAPSAHLVVVQAPRLALPPRDHHRALIPVDPSVLENPVTAEAVALQAFAAWAHQMPSAPSDPSTLVRSLELRVRLIGRLVSELVERRLEWREDVYTGTAPAGDAFDVNSVDPWSVGPESLRAISHRVVRCAPCAGQGQINCAQCGGRGAVTCPNCNGEGKAYGYASNGSRRLMNCKRCEKRLVVPCGGCMAGKVGCAVCRGSGRMQRWLELIETSREDIQVEPDGEMTRAFRWGSDGTSASREEIESDARIVVEASTEGALSRGALAATVPAEWIDEHWLKIQPKFRPGERVRWQKFWLLEIPSVELAYALPQRAPTVIGFEGRRLLAPPAIVDTQFSDRARMLRIAGVGLAGLSMLIPIAYLSRGPYFRDGWLAAISIGTIAVAIFAYAFLRDASLAMPRARRWAVGAAIAAVFTCGFAAAAEPSLRAARRHIASGRFDKAEAELKAIGAPAEPSHAQEWANLYLARAQQSSEVSAIISALGQIPEKLPQHTIAARHLYETAVQTAQQRLAGDDPDGAEAILAQARLHLAGDAFTTAVGSEVSELRARARDKAYARCSDEACRWQNAVEGAQLAPTQARRQRLADARESLTQALTIAEVPDEPLLARLRRLRAIAALADKVKAGPPDADAVALAEAARTRVDDEIGKVKAIGAATDVAVELLGQPADVRDGILRTVLSRVATFWMVRNGRLVGLYLTGDERGSRTLNDSIRGQATARLLSQAIGRPLSLPRAPTASGAKRAYTRYQEGSVSIAARWDGQDLVELRIGDAKP